MDNNHQELVKHFREFSSVYRINDIFRDFIELSAIALINQHVFDERWNERENRYHEIRQKYTEDDFRRFPKILAALITAVSESKRQGTFDDVLGRLYMDLNLGNPNSGQYFTPYSISKLMSGLIAQDLPEKLDTQTFVSVFEPACGSGANLIAFAEQVRQLGYIPAQRMAAIGIDIDILCVWMCFIQCQLYRIPAKIVHGDSLTREFWSAWCTSDWVYGGFAQAMAEEVVQEKTADSEEPPSTSVPPALLTLEEQLVLF